MKRGVVLPTFRSSLSDALDVAARAAALGLDGVFAYDHLWPMRSPQRPSFAPFPVLARVARLFPSLTVGPLVARVGMVDTDHLVTAFRTLERVAPGRVVVGLGTGDASTTDELTAYGLPFAAADERRALLLATAEALRDVGPCWVGGGQAATVAAARATGAEVNLWQRSPSEVADAARQGPVNWAGEPEGDLHEWLDALAGAGATWAILRPGIEPEALASWPTTLVK